MDQAALLDVRPAAQPGAAQAAAVEGEREAALDPLGAQRESRLGLGLGDPGLPRAAGELLQDGAAVIALVGDQLGRALERRGAARRVSRPRAAAARVPSMVVLSP